MNETVLKYDNVYFAYSTGTAVLKGISFEIKEGEKAALIGCNGAGKSTLLLLAVGLEYPNSGEIYVCSQKVKKENLTNIRQSAGLVFQNPDDQLFMPTVYEDILFGLRNCMENEDRAQQQATLTLEMLGIQEIKDKAPYRLSGGEKRSAAIATVLAMQPKLLLFDEPTAFLDPRAKRNLSSQIEKLKQTVLIASHDMEFIKNTCTRALLMSGGRIIGDMPPGKLLANQALLDEAGL